MEVEFDDNQNRVLEDDHDKDFTQHGEAKDVIESTKKRKRSFVAEASADIKRDLPEFYRHIQSGVKKVRNEY